MPTVEPLYAERTIIHGTSTASADSTATQFLKVTGDDQVAPADAADAATAGMCYEDTAEGAYCPVVKGPAPVTISAIGGSPSVGDEIQVDATTGFPTKLDGGTPRGLITATDGDGFVVDLYGN